MAILKQKKFNFKRLMLTISMVLAAFYLINMLLAFFSADRLIFQPPPSSYRDNSEIIKLTSANGAKISAKHFPNASAKYTILFNHGNAEDIGTTEYFLEDLRGSGFAVFTYDYQGYGTSEGKSGERKSYEDAQAALRYLTENLKIDPNNIIVHGRSLGGAIAIDLVSREKCSGLIVESSFVSAFRVVTKYPIFPFDKFQSLKKLKQIDTPILFIHGKSDELIPLWHSEMMFAAANEPKFSLWIEGGHNDIFPLNRKSYLERIRDFSADLPK